MPMNQAEIMDTVQEESPNTTICLDVPSWPPSRRMTGDSLDVDAAKNGRQSRRPSAILATLRRPSQVLALNAAQSIIDRKKMLQESKLSIFEHKEKTSRRFDFNKRLGDDALTTALSALYAKLLVVLGIAFPVTEIMSLQVPANYFQGFYMYLYTGSLLFVIFIYITVFRERSLCSNEMCTSQDIPFPTTPKRPAKKVHRFGSFYLRLGAIAFGIGSMVYSGLDFGQYFELKEDSRCTNVMVALKPAARMILTMVQMQLIFLNSEQLELSRHTLVAKFGMMHMIGTNLCEWLHVIVEETKHEIIHIQHVTVERNTSVGHSSTNFSMNTISEHIAKTHASHGDVFECKRTNIMGSLVQNVSPFLFPCTVEYSLICAVILFEMWKSIKVVKKTGKLNKSKSLLNGIETRKESITNEKLMQHISQLFGGPHKSASHFSVDCTKSNKGLFSGIFVIVMTIISLIMFFVLNKDPHFYRMAIFEVNICEMILYIITLIAVIVAMVEMRDLKIFRKHGVTPSLLSLDTTLLVVAQTGVFIYCMFSMIGSYFTIDDTNGLVGLLAELFALVQTAIQTMFVLGAWWKRCRSKAQIRKRPGRQTVTFLLVANVALWTASTLKKGRAEFRPTHLTFFGIWPWTIITHVSVPMVIFYRFHSTICLYEIWKNSYKVSGPHHLRAL